MLWEVFHFFVNVVEVIVSVALILIVGVMVAKVAFWIVSRTLGKLAGPIEDDVGDNPAVPGPVDDTSVPSEDRPALK